VGEKVGKGIACQRAFATYMQAWPWAGEASKANVRTHRLLGYAASLARRRAQAAEAAATAQSLRRSGLKN